VRKVSECEWWFQAISPTIAIMRKLVTIELIIDESSELNRINIALALAILEAQPVSTPRESRAEMCLLDELSHTELRVLRYLPTNLSRPAIARELYVSVSTISTHIRNIYSKLDASNRAEAVERARRLRLIAN
jgi:DNA-binding NarL/FixJ family response regulator